MSENPINLTHRHLHVQQRPGAHAEALRWATRIQGCCWAEVWRRPKGGAQSQKTRQEDSHQPYPDSYLLVLDPMQPGDGGAGPSAEGRAWPTAEGKAAGAAAAVDPGVWTWDAWQGRGHRGGTAGILPSALTSLLSSQISDAVYRLVFEQAKVHFEAVLSKLQLARPAMEAVIRTDMDQIITSKEHLASKIRGRWPEATVHVLHAAPQGQASLSGAGSITDLLFC